MTTLRSGTARAEVAVARGCRLASLVIDGRELLVTEGPSAMAWGCFPMAPYAGRVGYGRFQFDGVSYRLPVTMAPHAIHGTVYDTAWRTVGPAGEHEGEFECDLGPTWPFPGFVRQRFELGDDRISIRLEVHAGERAMPASCGWHPWFRRTIEGAGGVEARFSFDAGYMEQRGDDHLPTGARVPPSSGPWDDCFGDISWPVTLSWPGVIELSITSDCPNLVVFTEPTHAICVEPQTAPPDALNRSPAIVEPGRPLVATTTWRWR